MNDTLHTEGLPRFMAAFTAGLALLVAVLAPAPMAQAHHDSATRICEKGHPGPSAYGRLKSVSIRRPGSDGEKLGRLVLAYRALGMPRFRVCAVALRKRHRGRARMKVRVGYWPAPHKWHRDIGRYRRYAGPVYRGGTYAQDGDRTIEVKATIGRGWNRGFALFSHSVPG